MIFFKKNKQEPIYSSWPFTHKFDPHIAKSGLTDTGNSVNKYLVSRLIKSYHLKKTSPSGLWKHIFEAKHKDIQEALDSKDTERISEVLSNPNRSDLLYGFDSNAKSLISGKNIPTEDPRTYDALLSLAEAVGVIRLYNPEAKLKEEHDIEYIIQLIEKRIGISIVMPSIYPLDFGLSTSRGVIHYRSALAAYQAWRTFKLLSGNTSLSVLEVGGGLGRAAYFSRMLGVNDYTIVDIPLTSMIQGYFLGHTLGENVVLLEGEPESSDYKSKIKLISPEKLFEDRKKYDIIVNFDGLTEFSLKDIERYWNYIKESTDIFLSVNHEANEIDLNSLINNENNISEHQRFPFWLRKGYVEEIIRIKTE